MDVVQQALPSECFAGIGRPILPIRDGGCPRGYRPRVTEVYAWGSAIDSKQKSIWFGTGPNALCADLTVFTAFAEEAGYNPVPAFDTDETTCEFDKALASQIDPELGIGGDARPAKIYQYDIATRSLTDRTPTDDPLITSIAGYRSAGVFGGVVFLAGIPFSPTAAAGTGNNEVVLLAYREDNGAFIGSHEMPQYGNPKVFFAAQGSLYAGFALNEPLAPGGPGSPNATWGQVVKWTGDLSDPFRFEVVANLGNQPAYLRVFEGRLVASTWPTGPLDGQEQSGIYMSPPLPRAGGLSEADAGKWTRVFDFGQYYPDPLMALGSFGGSMEVFGGELYLPTINVPGYSTFYHLIKYPQLRPRSVLGFVDLFLKSETAGHVFRLKNLGKANQKTELLYGKRTYDVFNPNAGRNGRWEVARNGLNQAPRFGAPGFGNPWQFYTGWGSTTFRGKPFFGGFDASKVIRDVALNPNTHIVQEILGLPRNPVLLLSLIRAIAFGPRGDDGVDVWYFDDPNKPAKPLTQSGFGNADNIGARDFWTVGDKEMYVLTQNHFNYPVGGLRNPPRQPGWQIIRVR